LIEKNRKYGNSALEPMQIFCKASSEVQLLARIDDKLNRIIQGNAHEDEDVVWDLIGYLVLLTVKRRMNEPKLDDSAKANGHTSSTAPQSRLVYRSQQNQDRKLRENKGADTEGKGRT